MIASFAALLAVRKKAHNADAVQGHNYYSGNKKPQIMRHTGVAGVINACLAVAASAASKTALNQILFMRLPLRILNRRINKNNIKRAS